MATKSAVKKHAKFLPVASSDLLLAAAEIDSQADAGRLDLRSFVDPDTARGVISDEIAPPVLEHSDPPPPVSSETFGRREPEPVEQRTEPGAPEGAAGARNAAAKPTKPAKASSAPPAPAAAPAPGHAEELSSPSYAMLAESISKAGDRKKAEAILEEARPILPPEYLDELANHFLRVWGPM